MNRSRTLRWAGTCRAHGGDGKFEKISVGKPEGKRLVGRSKRRWEV
jgi:hypothetical protein